MEKSDENLAREQLYEKTSSPFGAVEIDTFEVSRHSGFLWL